MADEKMTWALDERRPVTEETMCDPHTGTESRMGTVPLGRAA